MLTQSTQRSIAILREVVAGATYGVAARAHGLTRTAVEHRVKRIAKQVYLEVGIEGLTYEATNHLTRLRAHRADLEEALRKFERDASSPARAVRTLSNEDIELALRRAGQRSATPLRDVALVHVLLATGARPLEVARLVIRDYLSADGTVRECSVMRAAASVNRKERPLFFQSVAAREVIDQYLAQRSRECAAPARPDQPYRGFRPDERLFLDERGDPYVIVTTTEKGKTRHLCRKMLETYKKIFKRIGMTGVSAQTMRRTLAMRLSGRGANEKQIGTILGISEMQAVRDLLPRQPDLVELMQGLY